jgi:hypothetical protein
MLEQEDLFFVDISAGELNIELIKEYEIEKDDEDVNRYVFYSKNKKHSLTLYDSSFMTFLHKRSIYLNEDNLAIGISKLIKEFSEYISNLKFTGYDIMGKRPEFFI